MGLPRQKIEELLLEARLTKRKHVILEGPSDERFFKAWAITVPGGTEVIFTSVEYLHVDTDLLFQLDLFDGNRGRVVVAAKLASEMKADVRCVADRDCGHKVEAFAYETLLWTDLPALESLAANVEVLNRANLIGFSGKLPLAEEYVSGLSFALRELYAVRSMHPNLPSPKYGSGMIRSGDLGSFDVSKAVEPKLSALVNSYPRPVASSFDQYAFGHDLAELLQQAFGNQLRNGAGLRTRDAVEGALLGAVQIIGAYREMPLFRALADWIQGGGVQENLAAKAA